MIGRPALFHAAFAHESVFGLMRAKSRMLPADSYSYDLFGRRFWEQVGGARTYFMYTDEGLIAEFDGIGSQIKSYRYAPNSTWTTNPLFMKQGPEYYFYHNDHLGTPQKLTSPSGAVVWSVKYESFGKAEINSTSTIVNNLRFPGQYYDEETGLHYNYHRYYDPWMTKYLSPDPIGQAGGINLYLYVQNNPVNDIDPAGLWTTLDFWHFGIHQEAIYDTFGKQLLPRQYQILANAQVYADSEEFGTVTASYRHTLRAPNQDARSARRLANRFVRQQFRKAWELQAKGCEDAALHVFGVALHTLQDWTSPTHHDFQVWTKRPVHYPSHIVPEISNPGEYSELHRVTRDAWMWFNEGSLPPGDLFKYYGRNF